MTKRAAIICVISLFALSLATTLSADVADLEARASALAAEQASLLQRIDQCPDGSCADVVGIVAEVESSMQELVSIQEERTDLGPCPSCNSLDALVGQTTIGNVVIHQRILAWEESS